MTNDGFEVRRSDMRGRIRSHARRSRTRDHKLWNPDRGRDVGRRCAGPIGVRDLKLRGSLSRIATRRHLEVLAAYVAAGGSVAEAAAEMGIRPTTVKRHLAYLRTRLCLSTEQMIDVGRAAVWLVVPNVESIFELRT